MDNFKEGHLYSGSTDYGKIGELTKIHDDNGLKLFVGDVVETYDDENKSYGESVVAHDEMEGYPFVMGIACDCSSTGKISGGWHVKKRRSYAEVAGGENIDGIIYHVKNKPQFKVGQVYRIENSIYGKDWNGSIFKISGECHEIPCRFTTKSIRGKSPNFFDEGSIFSNCLTLLTGPQIREAIRSWDTHHAEKSEPEYIEVQRQAKVGEKIKIVAPEYAIGYGVGDIATVTSVVATVGVCADFKNCGSRGLYNCEYVVLEPKAGVKEVNRPAKVGEWVRLICSGGAYSTDEVCKVIADGGGGDVYIRTKKCDQFSGGAADRHIEQPFSFIIPDEYVVLEGYKPQGKHSYTQSEIAEAKKIVMDTICEQAENRKYVSFSYLGKGKDVSGYCAYVYGGEGCHFSVAPFGFAINKYESGKSKCSPNDEPNEWIGKCVALCKALHKPIPTFVMDGGRHFDFEKAKAKGTSKDGTMVVIHFKDDAECDKLLKAIEDMGICWIDGQKPTEWKGFDSKFVVVKNHTLYCDQSLDESNYVEFSDCFTGD